MPRYLVTIPISGAISIEVDAENEDAALDAAFDSEELTSDNIDDWEAHREMVSGNVINFSPNRASAKRL